jgi:ketosteroid isomerase-like protein
MNGLRARFVAGGTVLALSVLGLSGCRPLHEAPRTAAAPVIPAAMSPEDAAKAILDRDAEKVRAMVQADTKALGEILRDDLIYIHSSGPVDTKERVIDEIATGLLKYKAVETSEVGVRVYGDTGVLTGRAVLKVSTKGKAMEIPVRLTEVWVRTHGVWQLASWQATRIP